MLVAGEGEIIESAAEELPSYVDRASPHPPCFTMAAIIDCKALPSSADAAEKPILRSAFLHPHQHVRDHIFRNLALRSG